MIRKGTRLSVFVAVAGSQVDVGHQQLLFGFLVSPLSGEEIAEFRTKAKKTAKQSAEKSTMEFTDLLKDIERKRKRFAARAVDSEQVRKQQVAMAAAYQQKQVAQRNAARRARSSAATIGTSQGKPIKKREYRRPPPLIDSLDAARMEVMRNFYRRR